MDVHPSVNVWNHTNKFGTFASLLWKAADLGEVAEWLKAHAWKACLLERVTRVRIPVSPPELTRMTPATAGVFM